MKKPSTVKIGPLEININYSEHNDLIKLYEPTVQGKYIPEEHSIYLMDHELNPEQTKLTLLHEVVHAIDQVMNTGLAEEQVIVLTHGIMMTLKDNKEFTNYILNKESKNAN